MNVAQKYDEIFKNYIVGNVNIYSTKHIKYKWRV